MPANPFLITQPYGSTNLGEWLLRHLADRAFTKFEGVSAFVQRSGVACIRHAVLPFCGAGNTFDLVVGVDMMGTSYEGLRALLDLMDLDARIAVRVCKNPRMGAFHPKGYAFTGQDVGALAVGSGNLTARGLYVNYELAVVHENSPAPAIVSEFSDYVRELINETRTTQRLDEALLNYLVERRLVVSEAEARANTAETSSPGSEGGDTGTGQRSDTRFEGWRPANIRRRPTSRVEAAPAGSVIRRFVMTLQQTDVGVGQVTQGTQRRSPEIFIPLAALRYDKPFWKWSKFLADPEWTGKRDADGNGKLDRHDVKVLLGTDIVNVNLFYNPNKGDLRIRGERLRSAGSIGDILQLELVDAPDFEYIAKVIPQASVEHAPALAQCTNRVAGSSRKQWGYY